MRKILALVLAAAALLILAGMAGAETISDMKYLTFTINGEHYTLGSSHLSDLEEHGWTYTREEDGKYSFEIPGEGSYFYAVTADGTEETPVAGVDLMWADGLISSYLGFSSADPDRSDEFWTMLVNTYAASETDEGHLLAMIPVSRGKTVLVETADVRVSLGLYDGVIPGSQVVRVPEQDFSTLAMEGYTCSYHPDAGMTIFLDKKEQVPYVNINRVETRSFDAKTYLTVTLEKQMRDSWGADYLGAGNYETIQLAGRAMHARLYAYRAGGQAICSYVVLDQRPDSVVRYEGRYLDGQEMTMYGVLGIAAVCYRPDAYFYDPEPALTGEMDTIVCAQQGFSVQAPGNYACEVDPQDGVTFYTEREGSIPWVSVTRAGNLYDSRELVRETVTPNIRKQYGEDLLSAEVYDSYPLGGRDMTIGVYRYRLQDHIVEMVRAYEARDGHTVMYCAKYLLDEGEKPLKLLQTLASTYHTEGRMAPMESGTASEARASGKTSDIPEGYGVISVPEMEFSTLALKEYPWTWDRSNGVTIYTRRENSIPYVLVFRSEDWLVDVADYMHEQYTPRIRKQYGDDLISVEEHVHYTLGGRDMPAAIYTYRLQGYTVIMIRAWDTQDGHTVVFTAKYVKGEGEKTLQALEDAVRNYRPGAHAWEE